MASDTYAVSSVVFLWKGLYPVAEQNACSEGRLRLVFGMFVARRQRCNPAMTDNVTVRFYLRGSPYKEGDSRKAGNIKAVIERRGKCWRGKESKSDWKRE